MINKTKVSIRQGSFHLLFWGWLLIVCSLSAWLLANYTSYGSPLLCVVPGYTGCFCINDLWVCKTGVRKLFTPMPICYICGHGSDFLLAATVLSLFRRKAMQTVTPYILLLAGFPTFLSGFIIKFRPLIAGGICFWIIALLVHFAGPSLAPLGTPVAMLIGYLIPGYMLKNKVNHDKV